ncbi:MAG: OmpA family protein [Nitrospiraceae bacterium]|nr:OmpA family protein [Nitrospiraceae bacterium]MDA8222306.1 OmpA family protein [Desulfitobacterium hafniense]
MASSGNQLANSFTDLMTSLAVIFILLLCVTHNEAQQEGETTRNSILLELKNELREFIMQQGVKVDPDPKDPLGLLILVPEGLLDFDLNRSEIPPKGIDFLHSFIPRLANIVCDKRFRDDINSIVVEGHTDSSGPANMDKDQYNWDLSQRRSMAVVAQSLKILNGKHMLTSEGKAVKDYFVKMLSASGRGSAELKIDESTGLENREQSRRVVFKIRVRSLEQRLVKAVVS